MHEPPPAAENFHLPARLTGGGEGGAGGGGAGALGGGSGTGVVAHPVSAESAIAAPSAFQAAMRLNAIIRRAPALSAWLE